MAFYLIYIKEIHPSDGWQVGANERDGVLLRTHRDFDERIEAGQSCTLGLELEIPALVDGMDDAVNLAWNAMPERLALVGTNGKVVFKSGPGPMFFLPAEWERAISTYLDGG